MIALVLHGPSRFDKENNGILLGPAGDFVRSVLAGYNIDLDNPSDVFITFADDFFKGANKPSGIKKIIFAGSKALDYLPAAKDKSLDAFRGVVYVSPTKTQYIVTYWPQDCVDAWAMEDALEGEGDGEDILDKDDGKSTSPTKRSNYSFWFSQDVKKLLTYDPTKEVQPQPDTVICTRSEESTRVFNTDGPIFLDIETHPKTNTLTCLAIACGESPVYSIPVYDWNGNLVVGVLFFARLIREMKRRRVVIHNALFDLCFLAAFYKIPFGTDIYDTVVAGHRIYPEAEKSLAHQATLFSNRPFHKDEAGNFDPRNRAQFEQLRAYNVKDVIVLREIYYGQIDLISRDRGLQDSVDQASRSLADYAFMSLHGMHFDPVKRGYIVRRCEERYRQLQRVLKILVGFDLNPGSPDQVVNYLHTQLRYKPEKTTDKGSPSVAGDALYKIKLKHPKNVAIDVIFEMRRMVKLKGMLGFQQWIWEY